MIEIEIEIKNQKIKRKVPKVLFTRLDDTTGAILYASDKEETFKEDPSFLYKYGKIETKGNELLVAYLWEQYNDMEIADNDDIDDASLYKVFNNHNFIIDEENNLILEEVKEDDLSNIKNIQKMVTQNKKINPELTEALIAVLDKIEV